MGGGRATLSEVGCGADKTGSISRASSSGGVGGAAKACSKEATGTADSRTSIAARGSVKAGKAGAVASADSWGDKGEMGAADSMDGSGANVVMSAGGTLAGEGVGDRAAPSGSGSASSGQMDGACCWSWVLEAGDNGMAAMVGVAGAAGDRRASSAARVSVRAGAGGWGKEGGMGVASEGNEAVGTEGDGNEAARGACAWASSCCGYTSRIAALNFSCKGESVPYRACCIVDRPFDKVSIC